MPVPDTIRTLSAWLPMGIFDAIEKLITEHGSAAILHERIALAREEHAALEKKISDLQSENARLRPDNEELREKVRTLEKQLSDHASNTSGYFCDHCGSGRLKRTGNRPDPLMFDMGIKQAVFSCLECGKESAYTQDP